MVALHGAVAGGVSQPARVCAAGRDLLTHRRWPEPVGPGGGGPAPVAARLFTGGDGPRSQCRANCRAALFNISRATGASALGKRARAEHLVIRIPIPLVTGAELFSVLDRRAGADREGLAWLENSLS